MNMISIWLKEENVDQIRDTILNIFTAAPNNEEIKVTSNKEKFYDEECVVLNIDISRIRLINEDIKGELTETIKELVTTNKVVSLFLQVIFHNKSNTVYLKAHYNDTMDYPKPNLENMDILFKQEINGKNLIILQDETDSEFGKAEEIIDKKIIFHPINSDKTIELSLQITKYDTGRSSISLGPRYLALYSFRASIPTTDDKDINNMIKQKLKQRGYELV